MSGMSHNKDACIVHIYSGKSKRQSCDIYRGTSLLYITGKILVHILLNRLIQHLQRCPFPESAFSPQNVDVERAASRQLQKNAKNSTVNPL